MKVSPLIKSFFILWICHLFMDFFTGIWPIYKTLAQIDIAKAGLIAGISGFLGEVLQIGFGYLCDKGHRKKVLIFGLLFSSSIIWITFVEGILPSFFLLLLLMIGSGSFHPAAVGMAGKLSKEYKGRGILFFASGGAIGYAVSQLTFTHCLTWFSGHALPILIPFGIVFALLLFHRFPEQDTAKTALPLREIFKPILHAKKSLLLLYFTQVANQLLYTSLLFLLPDFLQSKGCHSWICMGGGHLCFVLGSACAMVPAGFLCDKYGQKIVLLTVICCASFFLYSLLMPSSFSFGSSFLFLMSLGAFLGIINPIIISWGNRLVPESPSTVSALLMGFAWCIGNLGPLCSGAIAPYFSSEPISTTLSLMGASLIICLVLVLFIPQPAKAEVVIDPQKPLEL